MEIREKSHMLRGSHMRFLRPSHGVTLTDKIRSKNIRSPLVEKNVIEEIGVINVYMGAICTKIASTQN
jgi:hypothetical protein